MKKEIVLLVCLAMTFSSCASIMHGGGSQTVGLASNPTGAAVTIEGQKYTTPARVDLKRNQNYTGIVEKEGYETASFTITKKISGWIWGNIVFGGIIGLVVDLAIGGAHNLAPENVTVDLKRGV